MSRATEQAESGREAQTNTYYRPVPRPSTAASFFASTPPRKLFSASIHSPELISRWSSEFWMLSQQYLRDNYCFPVEKSLTDRFIKTHTSFVEILPYMAGSWSRDCEGANSCAQTFTIFVFTKCRRYFSKSPKNLIYQHQNMNNFTLITIQILHPETFRRSLGTNALLLSLLGACLQSTL